MTEVVEEKVAKPDYKVRLSEKYAINTDPRNIILLERYEKKDGKGKLANNTGEFGWRDVGFFRDLNHLAERLVKHEMFSAEDVADLGHFAEAIESLKNDIANTLKDKIEVKLD